MKHYLMRRYLTISLSLGSLTFIAGLCTPDPDPTPQSKTPSTPSTPSTPTTPSTPSTTQRTTTNPDTHFIDLRKTYSKNGEWTVQEFTLSQTTTFIFRVASQYKAQTAIISESELNNFKTNNSFRAFSLFDNQYGTKSATLGAGKYYIGIRNTSTAGNIVSLELDYAISLPASDRCQFNDYYINDLKALNKGAKLWQPFTIQTGFRYFFDGCNTGFDTYIIPENQLDNFKSGRQFTAFSDYTDGTGAAPGLYEIKLPAGTYYFVAANSTNDPQAIVYTMERWQLY